ncbi:hypothetical protein TNCV_2212091 [Trichonephila clavipes]|nr:hypothetical protein TNCV_2212091 [Trichonephila clavipes]
MPIFGPAGTPTAIPTKLGYILSGKIYAPPLKESIVNSSLNDQLSELWKLEEVPKTNVEIQIPDPCEESFSKSVKRNCKELLPASGNRSNKRRDREEDLATTEEKRSERGRRGDEKSRGREK